MTVYMPFGKHKGKPIDEIWTIDQQYLVWLRKQSFIEKFKNVVQAIDALDSNKN